LPVYYHWLKYSSMSKLAINFKAFYNMALWR
jgi:hypothetical protein